MAIKVTCDTLAGAIDKELSLFSFAVVKAIKTETDKAMKQLVAETKATAPVGHRHKHYRDSITSKVTQANYRGYEKTWYVQGSDYRLSHLLNNGHMLRNGDRYPGTGFITKASVSVIENYTEAIKAAIERSGRGGRY